MVWCQEQVLPFIEHLLFAGSSAPPGRTHSPHEAPVRSVSPSSSSDAITETVSSPKVTPSGGTELGFEPGFLPQRADFVYKQQDGKSLRQPLPCGQTHIGTLGLLENPAGRSGRGF